MIALAIESSCDETSLTIVQYDSADFGSGFIHGINSVQVLSHIISSQIKIHQQYGGVVPEVGAREHAEQIHALFLETVRIAVQNLKESKTLDLEGAELTKVENSNPAPHSTETNDNIPDSNLTIKTQNLISQIAQIFVTTEPGLKSALRVGLEFAKSLQFFIQTNYDKNLEVIPVNHLHGHVASCFYNIQKNNFEPNSDNNALQSKTPKTTFPTLKNQAIFPHLHLLVSGGNSQILLYSNPTEFRIVGKTLDDAAGECFDKTARMLGLKYPGGVLLSKIAGNTSQNPMKMPVSMLDNKELNFSFSGLKTAVRYSIQKQPILELEKPLSANEISQFLKYIQTRTERIKNAKNPNFDLDLTENIRAELDPKLQLVQSYCQSIQTVIVKQLMSKLQLGINQYQPMSLGISGGVCANPLLRLEMTKIAKQSLINHVFIPDFSLTGDNAVMIALAGVVGSVYKTPKAKDLRSQ